MVILERGNVRCVLLDSTTAKNVSFKLAFNPKISNTTLNTHDRCSGPRYPLSDPPPPPETLFRSLTVSVVGNA